MNEQTQAIPLPATTRRLIEDAARQRDIYQAMMQQHGQMIDALVAAAREMLRVPDGYVLNNTAIGFEASDGEVKVKRAAADSGLAD